MVDGLLQPAAEFAGLLVKAAFEIVGAYIDAKPVGYVLDVYGQDAAGNHVNSGEA